MSGLSDGGRERLATVVREQGVAIADDATSLEEQLRADRRLTDDEVDLLLAAQDAEIPAAVTGRRTDDVGAIADAFARDRVLPPERARWAVDAWVAAMGATPAAQQPAGRGAAAGVKPLLAKVGDRPGLALCAVVAVLLLGVAGVALTRGDEVDTPQRPATSAEPPAAAEDPPSADPPPASEEPSVEAEEPVDVESPPAEDPWTILRASLPLLTEGCGPPPDEPLGVLHVACDDGERGWWLIWWPDAATARDYLATVAPASTIWSDGSSAGEVAQWQGADGGANVAWTYDSPDRLQTVVGWAVQGSSTELEAWWLGARVPSEQP